MSAETGCRRAADRPEERGFALVAVLLVLALVGTLGAEFAFSMRLEASAARAYEESVTATHLAEAGLAQAMREIAADAAWVALAEDGDLTFYTRYRIALPRLPRVRVPFGPGRFSYRLSDEEGRLNLNTPPERMDRLLQALGLDKSARDVIVDSLQDWRDPNEEHRLNGAESEDYYLKLPVPYRSRNANLESVAELLQIRGVTPRLFYATRARAGSSTSSRSRPRVESTSIPRARRCCGRSAWPRRRSPRYSRVAGTALTRMPVALPAATWRRRRRPSAFKPRASSAKSLARG